MDMNRNNLQESSKRIQNDPTRARSRRHTPRSRPRGSRNPTLRFLLGPPGPPFARQSGPEAGAIHRGVVPGAPKGPEAGAIDRGVVLGAPQTRFLDYCWRLLESTQSIKIIHFPFARVYGGLKFPPKHSKSQKSMPIEPPRVAKKGAHF